MKLAIPELQHCAETSGIVAKFATPASDKGWGEMLKTKGFIFPRAHAAGCIQWIWCQWLLESEVSVIRERAEFFVSRGLKIRELSSDLRMRSIYDLYLLHVAIFACNSKLLLKTAELVDVAHSTIPKADLNYGESYAAACCGMLKYWILGDEAKCRQQFDLIWSAYRGPTYRGAAKPLIVPWLKKDWSAFTKNQKKDFEKLWSQARKSGMVQKETKDTEVVALRKIDVQQIWCWAHCGMALLAYRFDGVEVATDSFWFPAHALKCVDRNV
jgi:hypothetical protein